ncbi:MAG: biotin/lipoyl-containing protein [Faecousia sp.]
MLMLTAVQNTQPDYAALAMVLVFAIIVAVMATRKRLSVKNKETDPAVIPVPAEPPKSSAAPGSAGQVKLYGVEPKTAAMLMAIVANKMGKPLNELRFISIHVVPGEAVKEGDMTKMENEITSPKSGTVTREFASKGSAAETGTPRVFIR